MWLLHALDSPECVGAIHTPIQTIKKARGLSSKPVAASLPRRVLNSMVPVMHIRSMRVIMFDGFMGVFVEMPSKETLLDGLRVVAVVVMSIAVVVPMKMTRGFVGVRMPMLISLEHN